MSGNSMETILAQMAQGSITVKWGAVCAFDRESLNRVLLQQWLEQYDGANYVPVFSGKMDLSDSGSEYGELTNVLLGKPLLSFEPAALDNSRARLTLSLLGGTFTAYHKERVNEVMYSYTITEAQGFTLTVELDLSMTVGEVDRLGRVTLRLSHGVKFACNLAAPALSQEKIGQFFQAQFQALPPQRQVFVLGILDLKGGGDLTPTNFIILTQRAPGAERVGAANAPEGAVVVMVKLRGNALEGDIPSKDYFPYLIPDDLDKDGRKYSATLVLAQEFVSQSTAAQEALIRSLLFPGRKHEFIERERHVPHDMVVFGALDPARSTLTIEPAVHSLKAGGAPVQYTAYWEQAPLTGVAWSVKSLNTLHSSGQIDPVTGLYQPVSAEALGQQVVRNIITAQYTDADNIEHRVSALLLVSAEAMALSPDVVFCFAGGGAETFVASALSSSTLHWDTPEVGTLTADGRVASYLPPAKDDMPSHFIAQPITVHDDTGETVQSLALVASFPATQKVSPSFVQKLARSATVQLQAVDAPGDLRQEWSVQGEGQVVDGLFTAPAAPVGRFSVVTCDLYDGDRLISTGYSIIHFKAFTSEPGWTTIRTFELTGLLSSQIYGNGYQQFPIQAKIETDGERLTLDEENSLTLFVRTINQEVPEVEPGQEGIAYNDPNPPEWAQMRFNNRFRPHDERRLAIEATPAAEEPNYVHRFLVSTKKRSSLPTTFYAAVKKWDEVEWGQTFYSNVVHDEGELGYVSVVTIDPPDPNPQHYDFRRQRVAGGGNSDDDDDDNFDYYLKTTDYWRLFYRRDGLEAVVFEIVDIEGPHNIVRWESNFGNERMFSYTGYAFNDPLTTVVPTMQYDQVFRDSVAATFTVKDELEAGQSMMDGHFLVAVFRRDDVRQSHHPALSVMRNMPLKVTLIDNDGNRHRLSIDFSGGRNLLSFNFF